MDPQMIKAVPSIAQMAAYQLAEIDDPSIISLAQNESAFDASPNALAAARVALSESRLYPDPNWTDLKSAIAQVHQLDPAKILCGAGSMELIGTLMRCYVGPGDHVVGSEFGYGFVETAVQQVGGTYERAPEDAYHVSIDAILSTVNEKIRVVFVCNPGNPTGTNLPNSELIRLREGLRDDILLVIDQAYGEFCDPVYDRDELFQLVERGNTIITRSFSKAYCLASARVGWGIFPPAIAHEMRKVLNPNNISTVSQAMATAAVLDQPYLDWVVSETAQIRDHFASETRQLGISVPTSHTNFALLCFRDAQLARQADDALRQEKLLLRALGGPGLSHTLRATICNDDVMQRVIDVLKRVV